jgi:hypothetical protein
MEHGATPSPAVSSTERYRATTLLLVLSPSDPIDPSAVIQQTRKGIESRRFARDLEAASGVAAGHLTIHACAPPESALMKVAVDAADLADAKAASAKLGKAVNDSPTLEGPSGTRVKALYKEPSIEKDPPTSPPHC